MSRDKTEEEEEEKKKEVERRRRCLFSSPRQLMRVELCFWREELQKKSNVSSLP